MNTNIATTTTYFVGGHYEVANGVVTKYYYAGSQRIAMRTNGTLNYILGDHLGSTSLVTDSSGNVISQQYYKAWGETRYASGTSPTKYQYTGQYSYTADFGLHFYNARWYDSSLSRFAQADTVVPAGVQGYDRYAYVNNSPIRYTDPTGHLCEDENTWGYCGNKLPTPWQVKEQDKGRYIRDVARKYNIKLPQGIQWSYYDGQQGELDLGFIVWDDRTLPDNRIAYDEDVYIGRSSFYNPQSVQADPNRLVVASELEFASVLVHESEHAWQRYYDDIGLYTSYPQRYDSQNNLTNEFRAVTEADSYTVQMLWLNAQGVNTGSFYDTVKKRSEFYIQEVASLNLTPGNGLNYTFPLPIYQIAK